MDTRRDRQPNFELLRIVLMLLIIAGHITMYSGKLTDVGTTDYYISNFLRSFTMIAVNAFVLLTGFFGTNRNWKKLFKLDLRVCIYTWAGFALAVALGVHTISLTKDIQLLFPVITKQYWYVTVYFVLCIFSPYLNVFLENISPKSLKEALLCGGGVLYVIATLCFLINANQIVMDAGYGIVNFVYLYCLGYYIRHYYVDRHSSAFWFGIYLLACLGTFFVNAGMSWILGFYFNSMISYNTVFTLAGAIGLFMCFKNLKIRDNRKINSLAKHSMSVYLIHMHPLFANYIFEHILNVDKFNNIYLLLIIVVGSPLLYLICSVISIFVEFCMYPFDKVIENKTIVKVFR